MLTNNTTSSATTETVWRSFRSEIHAFISRRVSVPAVADDLVQEVFVRVHRGIDRVADDSSIGAWVFTIARHVVIDYYRGRKPIGATTEEPMTDGQPDAADENLNELVGKWLRSIIPLLPEIYRDAVKLADVDGLKQREVAEQLGLSLSGAKSRIQRGRTQLKQMLFDCCDFEIDCRGNVLDYKPRPGRCR